MTSIPHLLATNTIGGRRNTLPPGYIFYARPVNTLVSTPALDGNGDPILDEFGDPVLDWNVSTVLTDTKGLSNSRYIPIVIPGTAYYLDGTCEFNGDGSSPEPATANGQPGAYNSIAGMQHTGYPNNTVLYVKRGQKYVGSLYVWGAQNPVTILPYGEGHPPIILGDGTYAAQLNGKTNVTYHGIWFMAPVYIYNGSTNMKFYHCACFDSNGYGFQVANASSVEFINCLALNNFGIGWDAVTGGVITLINCIAKGNVGGGLRASGSGSSISHNNCCVFENVVNGADEISLDGGVITDLGDELLVDPLVSIPGVGASEFVLTFDNKDVDYWVECAAAFPTGLKATFFLQKYDLNSTVTFTQDKIDAVKALLSDGHEIGIHTLTHSDLRATTAFTITSTNTSPTIDVDIAGDQITLWCDEVENRVTLQNISEKNIFDLRVVATGKGWFMTNATFVYNGVILDSLNDTSGPQALPYATTMNVTAPDYRYWRNEIIGCRDYITNTFGYTPTTLAYPVGYYTENLIVWVKEVAGLTAARGYNTEYAISRDLSAINIFLSPSVDAGDYAEAVDENSSRNYARKIFNHATTQGLNISFLTHRSADITALNLGYILDELVNGLGVEFKTYKDFINSIKSSHSTVDGYTYTKDYPVSYDLSVSEGSPCIGAGTKSAFSGDYDILDANGVKIYDGTYQLPDGPYIDGIDIGPASYLPSSNRVYPKIANPSVGVFLWESAPDILDVTGVDNAVYNADGTGKEFATAALASAAMRSLADNIRIFAGDTQVAIYSTDQSAIADKINRALK